MTHPHARPIHERIKSHVEDAGLTEEQIAKRARWSSKRVHRLLRGDTRLLAQDVETFARILRKPVADLYRDPPGGHVS